MRRGESSRTSTDVGALFDRYAPMVYRRARRILGSHEDAEEATSEVFIRALKNAERFEARASVSTWLYSITTNYCLNKLRDRRRRDELREAQGPGASLGVSSARAEQIAVVRQLLEVADPQQAQAVMHVHLDGMSHAEAAKILGVSKRTVGNLLDRFTAWAKEQGEMS